MTFEFYPMVSLRQDLRFSYSIVTHSQRNKELLRMAGESPDDYDTPMEELRRFQRHITATEKTHGKEVVDRLLTWYTKEAQEYALRSISLSLGVLESLIAPKSKYAYLKGFTHSKVLKDIQASNYKVGQGLANAILKSKIRMQVLAIPVKSGDGKQFRAEIKKQMKDFRLKVPLFSKLYSPVGLEVLFVPPAGEVSVVRDMDNVMRKIVPSFHEEFSPPISSMHTTDLMSLPADMRDRYRQWMSVFPKGLKSQVLNYEIFRVAADRSLETRGQVSIGLCEGQFKRNLLDKTQDIVEKWWEIRDDWS